MYYVLGTYTIRICTLHKHELLNVITVVCVKLYYKTLSLKMYILFNKMKFSNVRLDKIYTFKIKLKLSTTIYQILQSQDSKFCEGVRYPNFSQL